MKISKFNSLIIFSLFSLSILFGRDEITLIAYKPFPSIFNQMGFSPDKVQLGFSDDLYLLDKNSRQICRLDSDQNVLFYGGFGRSENAFFEPTWIGFTSDGLWVLDRTENRLGQLDYRLNKIRSIDLAYKSYPEQAAIDPFGRFFLLSHQYQIIHGTDQSDVLNSRIIEFSDYNDIMNCNSDFKINENGDLGLLTYCDGVVHIFNSIGKRIQVDKIGIEKPQFLVSIRDKWLVLNENGEGEYLFTNNRVQLPGIVGIIKDVISQNRTLIILSKDQVLYLNVPSS
ncbi:MAG: hypothetical protein ISR83_08720 [Candidatus Marinimicrobia bacterium]|nr:hypothetical protein [Candidatus Neomarinimicrobiota bacterium]